jgi:hypothetical protein
MRPAENSFYTLSAPLSFYARGANPGNATSIMSSREPSYAQSQAGVVAAAVSSVKKRKRIRALSKRSRTALDIKKSPLR